MTEAELGRGQIQAFAAGAAANQIPIPFLAVCAVIAITKLRKIWTHAEGGKRLDFRSNSGV
jgi:hypothetical protein